MSGDWEIDAELLERWRSGDLDAGEQLYARHANWVIRFFRNKVQSEAEELIHETFARVFEARDRIREGRALHAFIVGVAERVLKEHFRKRSKTGDIDPEVDSVAALSPGPSTIAARKLEQRLLLEGLRRIPMNHQIVLELTYWEGIKANELAVMMDVPHSTMRGRVQRARDLLEKAIAELAEAPELLDSTLTHLDDWAEQIRLEYLRGRDPDGETDS